MKEEEVELWRRFRKGDEGAPENLILYYQPWVKLLVKRVAAFIHWADHEDLQQTGLIALIEAAQNFQADGERSFMAYARKFILGAIFKNPEVTRTLSNYQYKNYRLVMEAHDQIMQNLMREPTWEEISEVSGLTVDQVCNAFAAMAIAFAKEIPEKDAETSVSHRTVEHQDELIFIEEALSRLSEKMQLIVRQFYYWGKSDREISEEFDLKEDTVTKTRKRAIKKLGELLEIKKGGVDNEA
jgi:RNA polymerase sigma factor FliA